MWFKLGQADLLRGIVNWRLCHLMGLGEIRRRYARSILGQFWLTISMAVMIVALGIVWSSLWKIPVASFMPYIATSLIVWTMISNTLNEAPTAFITTWTVFPQPGHELFNGDLRAAVSTVDIFPAQLAHYRHNDDLVLGRHWADGAAGAAWTCAFTFCPAVVKLCHCDCLPALSRPQPGRAEPADWSHSL